MTKLLLFYYYYRYDKTTTVIIIIIIVIIFTRQGRPALRGRNELCQFRFSFLGPFFQIWQFFVVLHKIGHECIMTLHGRFTKITKKSKHGNVYNDRSTKK